MIEPARGNRRVEIGAVAARSPDRARGFAKTHAIPIAYGSYEELLDDDTLDAIYVSTPNSHHAAWSMASLQAGKHVLCEKPIAGNAAQARRMFDTATATGKLLMEAFHWRFHPFAQRMMAVVGRLSRPLAIEAEFSTPQIPTTDIRYQSDLGGGALMDLGCYAVHWVRTLLGEPVSVEAEMESTVTGVDDTTVGVMRYTDGSTATIRTSMSAPEKTCVLRAQAPNGWVRADNPLAPQTGNLLAWSTDQTTGEEEIPGPTTFEAQLKSFVEMVEDDGPQVVTPQDSIANMKVIDSMYRSGGLGTRP